MTTLLYLEDWNRLTAAATITAVTMYRDKQAIVLDQTIFYPQGGGQPWDVGVISGPNGRIDVNEVRFDNGIVYHLGTITGELKPGEVAQCAVDATRRTLNSRLHSAGHIIDMGLLALRIGWRPGKGYHFPDGPYVEYAGSLEGIDKERLKTDLERAVNAYVQENRPTTIRFMPKEQMREVCHNVPDQLPEGKPARVVMYGAFGVPCGGTHVNNLNEVGPITIRKIKQEKEIIRVGYDIAR